MGSSGCPSRASAGWELRAASSSADGGRLRILSARVSAALGSGAFGLALAGGLAGLLATGTAASRPEAATGELGGCGTRNSDLWVRSRRAELGGQGPLKTAANRVADDLAVWAPLEQGAPPELQQVPLCPPRHQRVLGLRPCSSVWVAAVL